MSETYKHGGHTVVVTPVHKTNDPETWDVTIRIDGTLHLLTVFGEYPPKLFPTSEKAVAYGKEAAEYTIDHPAKTRKKVQ